MKKLRLLLTMLRAEGPLEVMRRLAFRFSRVHTFIVMQLDLSDLQDIEDPGDGIVIKEVSRERLNDLRKQTPGLPEYFYRDESERLDRCWIGTDAAGLGFIAWISFRGSSGHVRLQRGQAEMAYIHNLERMRGRRLTARAVSLFGAQLRSEGFDSFLAVPHSQNPAIIRSFEACGFTRRYLIRRWGPVWWKSALRPDESN